MAQNFDVYNDKDEKVATNQPSPVSISGLNPVTKYSGYKIAYTGKDEKTTIDDFMTTNQVPGKPCKRQSRSVTCMIYQSRQADMKGPI